MKRTILIPMLCDCFNSHAHEMPLKDSACWSPSSNIAEGEISLMLTPFNQNVQLKNTHSQLFVYFGERSRKMVNVNHIERARKWTN